MDAVITYVNGMEPSGENNVLSIVVYMTFLPKLFGNINKKEST